MRYVLACLIAASLTLAVGCSSEPKPITAESLRQDMPADLHTPAETREEYLNRTHLTTTINMRKFNQDVLRLLLLDRPARTMDYPTALE